MNLHNIDENNNKKVNLSEEYNDLLKFYNEIKLVIDYLNTFNLMLIKKYSFDKKKAYFFMFILIKM